MYKKLNAQYDAEQFGIKYSARKERNLVFPTRNIYTSATVLLVSLFKVLTSVNIQ